MAEHAEGYIKTTFNERRDMFRKLRSDAKFGDPVAIGLVLFFDHIGLTPVYKNRTNDKTEQSGE